MPADGAQMHAIVDKVFFQHGCRFIFSTRSKTPYLLKEGTQDRFYGPDYVFEPGVDEVIREGTDLWVVSSVDHCWSRADGAATERCSTAASTPSTASTR